MGWKDRKGFLGRLHNVVDALKRPETYAPPPVAPPPRTPRARPEPTPPAPRISYVPRNDLPSDWGRNEAALWQDATKSVPDMARDEIAQMYYDAALYTFSDSTEDRRDAIEELKRYIWDEYGIDWDEVFDWESWRENYDNVAT